MTAEQALKQIEEAWLTWGDVPRTPVEAVVVAALRAWRGTPR